MVNKMAPNLTWDTIGTLKNGIIIKGTHYLATGMFAFAFSFVLVYVNHLMAHMKNCKTITKRFWK